MCERRERAPYSARSGLIRAGHREAETALLSVFDRQSAEWMLIL